MDQSGISWLLTDPTFCWLAFLVLAIVAGIWARRLKKRREEIEELRKRQIVFEENEPPFRLV